MLKGVVCVCVCVGLGWACGGIRRCVLGVVVSGGDVRKKGGNGGRV